MEDEDGAELDDQKTAIDLLMRGIYNQLNDGTVGFAEDPTRLRVGVRALIYSPNPGYFCSGYRCEWRVSENAWWLRYYYVRSGQCRKRWIQPC